LTWIKRLAGLRAQAIGDTLHVKGGPAMHYKHILLPVDGSDVSHKAEKECLEFAKSSGARVTALHVVSHFYLHFQPWATPKSVHTKIEREHEEEAKAIAQKMVNALAARAREKGVDCEGVVVVGDHPYEAIIRNAESRKCDLIMMASHGRRGLNAVLLGSETVKVLTHTKIPVLVVR
jgi:nucleotide-binding universal stress UspA family protein